MTQNVSPWAAVADALLRLTYGEMIALGTALRDLHSETQDDLSDVANWASLLHAWAEGHKEN